LEPLSSREQCDIKTFTGMALPLVEK
jgi:hypothetical protein